MNKQELIMRAINEEIVLELYSGHPADIKYVKWCPYSLVFIDDKSKITYSPSSLMFYAVKEYQEAPKKVKKTFYRLIYIDSDGDLRIPSWAYATKKKALKKSPTNNIVRIEEIVEEIEV